MLRPKNVRKATPEEIAAREAAREEADRQEREDEEFQLAHPAGETELRLIDMGASVWQKGKQRRIYFDNREDLLEKVFGLVNTLPAGKRRGLGKTSLCGEEISHNQYFKLCQGAGFYDCVKRVFVSSLTPII